MGFEAGFTGTSRGMTLRQAKTLARLFRLDGVDRLHLGDCIGADSQAWMLARSLYCEVVGHPPSNPKKRAFLEYHEEREPLPYMARNDGIVAEGVDGLYATPAEMYEVLRSGTWATVRRARKSGRRVVIVQPDGGVVVEEPGRASTLSIPLT